ncbi:DegQ family serine endoprotease [Ancylobacter dichloromethanicus]|uniref:Serine protease n=1 Tax=Ancylobacter dichloromethanicus TaxID=518825 RepID=A0A9W6J6R1_9HYPH|nr:DegQ family serine endoprotease [Ancylobacter dichloromethanicus]MBS7554691.1 DegQ family serine endoprotease [Ancylobacter dichloromethanicus]GLK71821.1 serine protease [Ancylobacter dichloromethanicus]
MKRFVLIVASLLAAAPALAQAPASGGPRVPTSRAEIGLSFAPVVARTAPAIVNVYALKTARRDNPLLEDPFFRRFFGDRGGPDVPGFDMPRERVQRSLGSGVLVDPSGIVVTNNHVIDGADEIRLSLADKREFDAEVVLRDPRTDIAILRIKDGKGDFPSATLGSSDDLQVGDIVLAIGNPFGVGQTVTQGIVSALARTQRGITDYGFFIQTDAAINPGNSGGALVDGAGRVVGINTAIFSRSGGSQGIGFAIPADMVRVVLQSALSGSTVVRRPWLGADLQQVTPDIAEGLDVARPTGALVQNIFPGSAAEKAGLRAGDLIVTVAGQEVDDPDAFGFRFATRPLGGSVDLGIIRQGKPVTLKVVLEAAPETVPRDQITISGRSPLSGATVVNLSPAVIEEMRTLDAVKGVVILSVEEGSPAERTSFRAGDVILDINGAPVATTADLQRITRVPVRAWRVTLQRGGRVISALLPG